MKNDIKFKVINNMSDKEYDTYKARYSTDGNLIVETTSGSHFTRVDLDLKVKSCDYGCNSYGVGISGLGHPMREFVEKLESTFGKVDFFDGISGFAQDISFEIDGEKCVYSIAAGNNGQEIVASILMQNEDIINKEEFIQTIKFLDDTIYKFIVESKLTKY